MLCDRLCLAIEVLKVKALRNGVLCIPERKHQKERSVRMPFIDEEIARMVQKERKKEREKEEKQKRLDEDASIHTEDIAEGIKSGACTIFDKTYLFQKYTILEERVSLYLPSEELEIRINEKGAFQSLNMEMGFSSNIVLSDIMEEFELLSVYKDNMEKNLKPSGFHFNWLEEGSLLSGGRQLLYLDFLNVTGLGTVHNSIWFIMTPYGRMQCTLNYDHEDDRYWKHMMRALMKLIEIK